jgi:hypothetical protein
MGFNSLYELVSASFGEDPRRLAQRAAIAVEWAERIEQDWSEGRSNTFVARVETGVQESPARSRRCRRAGGCADLCAVADGRTTAAIRE